MKDYKVIPQERNTYCLCSVLQAIFCRHGMQIAQDEIASKLTPSEKGFRVDDQRIISFLESHGFNYEHYWHNQTPFNEPDLFLQRMQKYDGILGFRTHVYLLQEFKDPTLRLIDPDKANLIETDIYEVLKEMQKSVGFFGLLKKT